MGSWRVLKKAGAKSGRRVLHKAAERAARAGASMKDGANNAGPEPVEGVNGVTRSGEEVDEQRKQEEEVKRAKEILKLLVEEQGLDINAMDTDE